jgi:hypothetical protein
MNMISNDVHKIVEQVIEAHGGVERWNELEAIEAIISVRGFLFKAKRRPILNRVRVRASAREPKFTFYDFPRTGQNSEFDGFKIPTKRRVLPLLFSNKPLSKPTIVVIDIHDFSTLSGA